MGWWNEILHLACTSVKSGTQQVAGEFLSPFGIRPIRIEGTNMEKSWRFEYEPV